MYEDVTGWNAFEPVLTNAEFMDPERIWACAAQIPEEWYGEDRARLEELVSELARRRRLIRKLIKEFRDSTRNPFPNWKDSVQLAVGPTQIVGSTGALLPDYR